MIVYGHFNCGNMHLSLYVKILKYHYHSICVNKLSMSIKLYTECVDHSIVFSKHIFINMGDTSTHIECFDISRP